MQILYFISEEKDTILTVIGLIFAAIGVIVAVIFSGDDSKKKIIRTVILAIVGLFIVMAIAVSAIHFWVMGYFKAPETVGEESNPVEETILQIGKKVSFGEYEQDCDLSNGKETIDWVVLDIQENKALLLSDLALDSQPYNQQYGATTWKDCTLHIWLEDSFLENAFTEEEKSVILVTEVDNSKSQNNKDWNVNGCENTNDMIFLLSYADTERYFDSATSRVCTPTDYAISIGKEVKIMEDGTKVVWWWLRSPGETDTQASFVNFDGTRYTNAVGNKYLYVRPALWIDIDKYVAYSNVHQ